MSCSTRMIAFTPARRAASITFLMMPCLSPLDTPLVGSSSRITSGESAKALAISRSFFSPCESSRASLSSLASSPKIAATSRTRACTVLSFFADANRRRLRPICEITATAMDSATVIAGKMCTSWKARAMPRCASSTGPMPAMSQPLNFTTPAVGLRSPVSTFTSVVLPAPLGPTMDTSSPSLIESDTLSSATKSP